MILSDLRSYLQERHRASLSELVIHFNMEPDALRGMLEKWISKEKVRLIQGGETGCGTSCCKCDPLLTEIYEWI